nr:MAG TPA: hypothetical protein [Caudoviricetes sp.]
MSDRVAHFLYSRQNFSRSCIPFFLLVRYHILWYVYKIHHKTKSVKCNL